MSIRDLVRRKKAPVSAEETNPLALFRSEMNRFVDSFWSDWPSGAIFGQSNSSFFPNIEVSETDKAVEISAELPGMTEKELEVTLSADASRLTLKGEKKFEEEKKEKDYHHFERSYGSFQRVIALPCAVDEKRVEATFKDGVLAMSLPKLPEEAQGIKKISVKGA
ncbi:MAG: Hsp20/alpha crystallin family protein [Proteobacteria bacterium]|nr:Hsp20/alpha crystallin family protein [Pseudomonadota bacterium]